MIGSLPKSSLIGLMSSRRSFSSCQPPAEKLRSAFATYRKTNFSRETPSRFRKEFAKAFPCSLEGNMAADDLNIVLTRIGLKESVLSKEELDTLLAESGSTKSRMLSLEKIMKLL